MLSSLRIILVLLAICVLPLRMQTLLGQDVVEDSMAQKRERVRHLIIGLGITATGFYGDLNYSPEGLFSSNFMSFYPGFNLMIRSDGEQRVMPMLNFGIGRFIAQNPDLQPVPYVVGGANPETILIQPNTYAETSFVYGEVGMHINLIRRYCTFRPYLSVAAGILTFTPKNQDGTPLVRQKSTRSPNEDTFEALTLSLPLSAGVAISLSKRVGLDFAYTYRLTGTDYLDNISELGLRKGNDELHIFRFGLYISFLDIKKK